MCICIYIYREISISHISNISHIIDHHRQHFVRCFYTNIVCDPIHIYIYTHIFIVQCFVKQPPAKHMSIPQHNDYSCCLAKNPQTPSCKLTNRHRKSPYVPDFPSKYHQNSVDFPASHRWKHPTLSQPPQLSGFAWPSHCSSRTSSMWRPP